MDMPDAGTLAEQLLRLKLVTKAQLQEVSEELGPEAKNSEALLRALERKSYITSWQTQKLLKGYTEGFYYGGYRVLYQVDAGSFGRVYRTVDPNTGRSAAIKVLRRKWCNNQQRIDFFMREGKVGMTMQHPNIVQMLAVDCDRATGQYYMVMEFVEGGNLRDFLAIRKKLEPAEALRLLDELVQGLAYAYSRGLSHRDIKPTNILISTEGRALLVDFGLAKVRLLGKGEAEKVERTVDYAILEKATHVKPGDVRSDIFFLGCVFYEMLTGRSPLPKQSDRTSSRIQLHHFSNIPPIAPGEVAGPPSVIRLVETMTAFNPQHRYQTLTQLQEAIRSVRHELEAKGTDHGGGTARSVFVVESNQRLLDAMRVKLKRWGYKVFLATDPARAFDRFRQQPFDALILDAGTTGEEGLDVFDRIMKEAELRKLSCAGILLLPEEQAAWAERVPSLSSVVTMIQPVTLRQLHRKLTELVPLASSVPQGGSPNEVEG